jgi:uncharacterized protein (TIGR00255 family)
MLSMTGFGIGEATAGAAKITVELRSVNHRFLDVAVKLPPVLASFEIDIRNVLKARVARGRVTVSAQIERGAEDSLPTVSPERLASGVANLHTMAEACEQAGLPRPVIGLEHLLALPGLFQTDAKDEDREVLREAVDKALTTAVDGLLDMKQIEGQETANEMKSRLDSVRENLQTVNEELPGAQEEVLGKLHERLAKLLEDAVEPQRLAQEAAIIVDRGNIFEEVERLATHLDQYETALDGGGQVAKRLNFLLQEMHREVNTMGSKTQNMTITTAVIDMKEAVESMREQVMNLE